MKKYPTLRQILNKKSRSLIITTVICLIITIGAIITSIVLNNQSLPDPQPLNNAIINDLDQQYSYIDVEYMSDYFAYYENDNEVIDQYYFVWDDEQFLYIALLDNSRINTDLKDIYKYSLTENDVDHPGTVRITGLSEEISEDLKEIAIETLNEWYGEGTFTDENFADYVGNYLINTKETPYTSISEIPMIIGAIAGMIGLIFGICLVVYAIQSKMMINKITAEDLMYIDKQIASGQAFNIHGINLYLTKNYVVDLTYRFQAYAYKDIAWLYLYRIKQYGATTSIAIKVGLKNGKTKTIAQSSRKYQQDISQLLVEIGNRCPDVLIGYTKENKQAFKAMKKSN